MNVTFSRALVVLGTAAALAAPAAAVAKNGGNGKQHGNPHSIEAKSKPKMFVFKGVVASVDADVVTVSVKKGNGRGRRATSQDVAFDVAGARVIAADTNTDGSVNAADVKVGDRVLVQARLPKDVDFAAGPHVARKLIDLTSPPVAGDDEHGTGTPPAT